MMTGWTIYDHPADYPDKFVVRKWVTSGGDVIPTTEVFVTDTLAEARALLPPGLVRFARLPQDEPQIVEVWM